MDKTIPATRKSLIFLEMDGLLRTIWQCYPHMFWLSVLDPVLDNLLGKLFCNSFRNREQIITISS